MTSNPRIFLSAGEASGDQYGAELIAELHRRRPGAEFFGLGGLKMAEAGLDRVVRAEDVAHMGITEVIRHMPYVYGQYRRLVASIKDRRPDVAVLIDFPDVNFRLARELKKLGVPVVWFVSPQLWAWKRGRLRWVQERVDRMMVIFPFEEAFYKARGVEAEFVGHPLAEGINYSSREEYAKTATELLQDQRFYFEDETSDNCRSERPEEKTRLRKIRDELDPKKEWIALLPGSRISEIRNNLRRMVDAAYEIGFNGYEFIVPVAPTITEKQLNEIRYDLADAYIRDSNPSRITFVTDARSALFHSRASIVASGTATVLAAVAGNPFVVVYRVSSMTYRVAKRLISYPTEMPAQVDEAGNLPVGMVNLIAGRRVVPELLQERFTGANVAAALRPLLADGAPRERMITDLAEVRAKLMPNAGSGATAIGRVTDAVVELLGAGSVVAG